MATPTTAGRQARPLWARKLDILYLIFFVIHVPIMFLIDLSSILPTFLVTDLSHNLVAYHLERFQDQFFTSPPAWFTVYMWLELVYHVPVSLWLVWALWNDHPLVPLNLLVFALEVALTTLTCLADISTWKGYTSTMKGDLYSLYVPYLVLASLMGIDAFFRVRRQVLKGANPSSTKGKSS